MALNFPFKKSTSGLSDSNEKPLADNEFSEAINLEGPEHNNIQAYPNPANNTLYIDNLPEDVNSIKIFNIEGKLVLDAAINSVLDISKIKEG